MRGLNACPCAQGLVRERAAERLTEAGYDESQIDEIFELLPAATHNQRAEATLMIGTQREIDARDLIAIAEHSMSAPVFELLKRPDELHVVEQAHLHPRFVEDSVRLMMAGTLEHYPDLSDGCFVLARQVNFETIHNHDVLAERHGVVAELRADLEGTQRRSAHTTARAWLESAIGRLRSAHAQSAAPELGGHQLGHVVLDQRPGPPDRRHPRAGCRARLRPLVRRR